MKERMLTEGDETKASRRLNDMLSCNQHNLFNRRIYGSIMPQSISVLKSARSTGGGNVCRIDTKKGLSASQYLLGLCSYSLPFAILPKGIFQGSLDIVPCGLYSNRYITERGGGLGSF
jgi:hypothetical protein